MKKSATLKSRPTRNRGGLRKNNKMNISGKPELTPEIFARAIVRRGLKLGPRKGQLSMRVDVDVLDWYRKQGRGYQTRINALLRAYMQENLRKQA